MTMVQYQQHNHYNQTPASTTSASATTAAAAAATTPTAATTTKLASANDIEAVVQVVAEAATQAASESLAKVNKYYYWEFGQTTGAIVIFCMIVAGNASILHRLKSCRRRRSNVNYFIIQLAIADLFVGIFSLALDSILRIQKSFPYGLIACRASKYISNLFIYSSTFLLVALSIDRWEAVVRPLAFTKNRNHGFYLVVGAWSLAFLSAIPVTVNTNIENVYGLTQCYIQLSKTGWKIYMVYLTCSLLVVPAIIIAICYIHIVHTIWRRGQSVIQASHPCCSSSYPPSSSSHSSRRQRRTAAAAAAISSHRQTSTSTAAAVIKSTAATTTTTTTTTTGTTTDTEVAQSEGGETAATTTRESGAGHDRAANLQGSSCSSREERLCCNISTETEFDEDDDDDDEFDSQDTEDETLPAAGTLERGSYQDQDQNQNHDLDQEEARQQYIIGVLPTAAAAANDTNETTNETNNNSSSSSIHPTNANSSASRIELQHANHRLIRSSTAMALPLQATKKGHKYSEQPRSSSSNRLQQQQQHHHEKQAVTKNHEQYPESHHHQTTATATARKPQQVDSEPRGMRFEDSGTTITDRKFVGGQQQQRRGGGGAGATTNGVIPKARIKTIKMTLVIVVAFILSWFPFCIINLCVVFGLMRNDTEFTVALLTLTQSLAHLNSAINPIIYWLFSSKRTSGSASAGTTATATAAAAVSKITKTTAGNNKLVSNISLRTTRTHRASSSFQDSSSLTAATATAAAPLKTSGNHQIFTWLEFKRIFCWARICGCSSLQCCHLSSYQPRRRRRRPPRQMMQRKNNQSLHYHLERTIGVVLLPINNVTAAADATITDTSIARADTVLTEFGDAEAAASVAVAIDDQDQQQASDQISRILIQ